LKADHKHLISNQITTAFR